MKNLTDEQVMVQLVARQEAALVELHTRYATYLSAVARRMLNTPDEVQSCVQDAFVNAWECAERYDPSKSRVRTWLVTICHRLAINRLRRTSLDIFPLQSWAVPARSLSDTPSVRLEQALAELDEEAKELIELAYFRGHSHGQVARLTGKPLDTVKHKVRGGLEALNNLKGGEA